MPENQIFILFIFHVDAQIFHIAQEITSLILLLSCDILQINTRVTVVLFEYDKIFQI